MSWCPSTDLDTANAEYEWMMGCTRPERAPEQKAVSDALATAFAEYVNSAGFTDKDGNALTLTESNEGIYQAGSYYDYIKSVIDHITLPGALFMAALAVIPSIIFYFTGNQLIQAFGGTSILIMVGVAMDTLSSIESQLKMNNYDGFFK